MSSSMHHKHLFICQFVHTIFYKTMPITSHGAILKNQSSYLGDSQQFLFMSYNTLNKGFSFFIISSDSSKKAKAFTEWQTSLNQKPPPKCCQSKNVWPKPRVPSKMEPTPVTQTKRPKILCAKPWGADWKDMQKFENESSTPITYRLLCMILINFKNMQTLAWSRSGGAKKRANLLYYWRKFGKLSHYDCLLCCQFLPYKVHCLKYTETNETREANFSVKIHCMYGWSWKNTEMR